MSAKGSNLFRFWIAELAISYRVSLCPYKSGNAKGISRRTHHLPLGCLGGEPPEWAYDVPLGMETKREIKDKQGHRMRRGRTHTTAEACLCLS